MLQYQNSCKTVLKRNRRYGVLNSQRFAPAYVVVVEVGADFLIDGGTTASYFYGDLQYLKATH